tara:strand:- start:1265 stop:3502 length:2238 start_codon:yes stop_codon:yes gene_type:complete
MGKFFLRFFIFIFIILAISASYLSLFGVKTDKFDALIKKKSSEINRYVKLGFQETKIHLNPKELNIVIKLQNPKILIRDNEILLSKLDLFLPLKSFFTSDFLLKRAEVAFVKNDIKDLGKITNIFLPSIINKKFNKIFLKGKLEGEFLIPFEADGSIGKGYGFSGKIFNSSINLTKEFPIRNLTTEIRHQKNLKEDIFEVNIKKGTLYDLDLQESSFNLIRKKNEIITESFIYTKGKFSYEDFKKISSVFNFKNNSFKNTNGIINLKTKINFNIDKIFRVKNLIYSTEGNIDYLEVDTEEKKVIKKYLPDYDPKVVIKEAKIKLLNSKSNLEIELNGKIKTTNGFDSINIKETYDSKKKNFIFKGTIDLTNSQVEVSSLNYNKKSGIKSEVSFEINFKLQEYYNIKKLNYSSAKNKIYLSNIKLNENYEVDDFENLEIKTFNENNKNNDFSVKKSDKLIMIGQIFDAQPLLKSLYKKSDQKTFSKNFNSEMKINVEKTLTGTNDNVSNFAMIASMKNGGYEKLSLKGNFSSTEILEMSIYKIDKDKKTLQVISDRARPFIKNFEFVKGFEGGKLEYESIISKENSSSNLLITDFKVSKVPALAQLLTLASLQGIADTLSGEGIRFESFEMKSNSKGNVLNIEDALAMGPAVSILLNGYVDKGKIVSLRGTLVPATKLNSIIASIPVVGDILVGKKTGEGVVGVSFKMKGPPKDIKTTVNPIKTLTPRFIVRAVEKMKKKKEEKAK